MRAEHAEESLPPVFALLDRLGRAIIGDLQH